MIDVKFGATEPPLTTDVEAQEHVGDQERRNRLVKARDAIMREVRSRATAPPLEST